MARARLSASSACALREAIGVLCRPSRGVPVRDILRLAGLQDAPSLRLDLAAKKAIGCPILVLRESPPSAASLATLSARERDVAALVSRGYTNKQIARALAISVSTTKDHVHHVLTKTGCASRAALAAMVARSGR